MDDYITLTVDCDDELSLDSAPSEQSDSDTDDHDLFQLDLYAGEETPGTNRCTQANVDFTTTAPTYQAEETLTSSSNQPCLSSDRTDSLLSITKETKSDSSVKTTNWTFSIHNQPSYQTTRGFHTLGQKLYDTGRNTSSCSTSEQSGSSISSEKLTDLRDRLSRKNSRDLRDKLSRQRRGSLVDNDVYPKVDREQEQRGSPKSPKERQVIIKNVSSLTPFPCLDNCQNEGEQRIIISNTELGNGETKAEYSSSCLSVNHQTHQKKSRDIGDFVKEIRHNLIDKDGEDICQEAADVSQHFNAPEGRDYTETCDLSINMADKKHSRGKRKWDSSSFCRDGEDADSPVPQGPKKQKVSRNTNSFGIRDRDRENQEASWGRHGRGKRSALPRRGRHHKQINESYETFVSMCLEKSPEEWNPDNLCLFLAQNGNHLSQALMEYHMRNRVITDRVISLLRIAFLESSMLFGNCRWQMMGMLKMRAFFESRSVLNIVKSLVSTRYRNPDENDTTVAGQLLDLMKTMTEAHILLKEDTVVFLGSLQAALRTGRIVVKGEDVSKSLMEKARSIEDAQLQPQSMDNSGTMSGSGCVDRDADYLVPILPNISDIKSRRHPGLVPRNVSEPFSSATEYVRYIFSSFREDFIGPLSKGIYDYIQYAKYQKKHHHEKKHKFWNQDVRLYENVRVLDTALSNDTGIDVTIQIDVSRLRNFNSRLVYGSLVCLLCDEFQSVIYAVISNTDKETLKGQGILNVHLLDFQRDGNDCEDFLTGPHGLAATEDDEYLSNRMECREERVPVQVVVDALQGHSVVMLESTAFYTAYVHSLQSLKSLHSRLTTRQSSLPFKKQLLQMSETVSAPRYLEASSGQVSFMCMKKYSSNEEERCLQQQLIETEHAMYPQYRPQQSGNEENRTVEPREQLVDRAQKLIQDIEKQKELLKQKYRSHRVCEPGKWPTAAELGLDDSQYAALRLALTHEVALIQGPPGTGKTTLGIRIAELLLKNERLWRRDENGLLEETPMLLLSYTNHALDQFLTELMRLPVLVGQPYHHVVRVGSRSEQEVLSEHNIARLRHANRADMDLRNEKKTLEDFRISRIELAQQIQSYKDGIVHHDHFHTQGVMANTHHQSLVRKTEKVIDLMLEWLCLDKDDFGESLNLNESYLHGSSFEKKGKEKRKKVWQRKSKREEKERQGGSSTSRVTGNHPENKSRNLAVSIDESKDSMDVGDDSKSREGMESEVSKVSVDEELVKYEEEMDMELERERRLYLDDLSEEESESEQSEHPSTSTRHEHEILLISEIDGAWVFPEDMMKHFLRSFRERAVSKIEHEVHNNDVMKEEEEEQVRDVWRLDIQQRWRLYRLWLKRLIMSLQDRRQWEENEFRDVTVRMEELRRWTDLGIMKKACVVAMTTTGAAKHAAVLRELRPRIVLVEEAAQVPEAHLLSSLSPACQHLIMIGDHQQLRPSYSNYDLTVRRGCHHIDISLFERLCRAGVPFQRLALQHRMQPDISSLLVPTIYPELKNHSSVSKYPDVKGVKVNVFFLTHSESEDTVEESRSKRNMHEAQFLASLYLYLRLQGYSEKDITVLALYKDQVLMLRSLIKKVENDPRLPRPVVQPEMYRRWGRPKRPAQTVMGARVIAVDNFQGEESRIILLSLVRSNKQGTIGYLKEDNRVCVALSRAKEGMFVIGNCSMLSKASPKCWKPILEKAEKSGYLGTALPLYCKAHDRNTPVSCHTDIDEKCRNGGCSERCDYRRECGHTCDEVCHSSTDLHLLPCTKPCVLTCPSGHPCGGLCYQRPCLPCREKCDRECPFGHQCRKECGQRCEPCEERCEKKLPCGHRCQSKCGLPCTKQCQEMEKVKGVCDHEFQEVCYKKQEGRASCRVPCGALLECQHPCPGKCGTCFAGRLHVACQQECKRVLVCRHECKAKCTQSCPPCGRQCEAKCVHSQKSCNKRCGEDCQKCMEPCEWRCRSKVCKNKYKCSKLCWEICDRPRCDQPCIMLHKCQSCKELYKCRGLYCEDRCPPACPRCNADIFEPFFGDENEPSARFYRMPDCRCVVEVGALDRYMDMAVAAEDDRGKVGPVDCPKCRSPVVTALRYGNVIKKTQADIDKVKRRLRATDPELLRQKQHELLEHLYDSLLFEGDDLQEWKAKTAKKINKACTLQELTIPENQINFLTAIIRLRQKVPVGSTLENKRTYLKMERYLECLEKWVMQRHSQLFSQQQLTQFQTELARADLTVSFCMAHNKISSNYGNDAEKAEVRETTQKCLQFLMSNPKVLSREEEEDMRKSFNSIKDKCCSGTLGISHEERIMIVKTMDFEKGHWFKCKNGHIYCITECGGAMEESKCPECGEGIGGGQHCLRGDNSLASEMDGATYAAWSEQANLGNYQF